MYFIQLCSIALPQLPPLPSYCQGHTLVTHTYILLITLFFPLSQFYLLSLVSFYLYLSSSSSPLILCLLSSPFSTPFLTQIPHFPNLFLVVG